VAVGRMDGTLSELRKEMITAVNPESQIIPDGSFRRTHQQNSPKPRRRRRVPSIKKEPRNVEKRKGENKRESYDDDNDDDEMSEYMVSIVGEEKREGGNSPDSLFSTSTEDCIKMIFGRDGRKTKRQAILVYQQSDRASGEKQSKE